MHDSFMYGALKSPDDPDDCIYEHVAHGFTGYYSTAMPASFDLRPAMYTARDQELRGTCAAFAGATVREIQDARKHISADRISPEFIYFHRQNRPASGMYGRNVFQILQKIGSVPESAYPYNTPDSQFDENLYEIAAQHRISTYARVTTADGLKRALLEIGPCYLQLPLYNTRPYFWRPEDDEPHHGGHAVAVVGYTTEGFILVNSWGHDWNTDGSVIFPYCEWDAVWECWVPIVDQAEMPEPEQLVRPFVPKTKNKRQKCTIMQRSTR